MKIIQLKCPCCGASLKVSDQLKNYTCNFCGTTSLLDDEIIKVEHTIKDMVSEEQYKKIDGYLKLGYMKDAEETINELIEQKAYDPKTWLYAIKVFTNNYDDNTYFDYKEIVDYLDNYKKLEEDPNEKDKNVSKIEKYITRQKNKLEDSINEEAMICPYCSEKIRYGQKKCKSCDNDLYWPSN